MDWLKGFSQGATICINDSLLHMVRNMSIFKPVSYTHLDVYKRQDVYPFYANVEKEGVKLFEAA